MIERIESIRIFVTDQQRAKRFYVDKLGFTLRVEAPMTYDASSSYIELALEGSPTGIILQKIDEEWAHYAPTLGRLQQVGFRVSDLDAVVEVLRGRGVEIVYEPEGENWGRVATIRDSEGNLLMLVQMNRG